MRLGARLSVLDSAHLGSSLSLRSVCRCASALSLAGAARCGSSVSLLGCASLGSALSLRPLARLGSSLSVGHARLGASLAMRAACAVGSALSVLGCARLGASLAVMECLQVASALSLRGCARLGRSLAVLDLAHVGASLSLRGYVRGGSSMSVLGVARIAASLSVLDFSFLGSSLKLRSSARLGSAISVLDFVHLGSSLAISGSLKVGSDTDISQSKLMPSNNYRLEYVSADGKINWYHGNYRAMSTYKQGSTAGGSLHGLWSMDTDGSGMFPSPSDRRLKENIRPVFESLGAGRDPGPSAAASVLQRLRPVSYQLRSEAGRERFGFIADEMEEVLPQVARREDLGERRAGIVYEDLLAVLVCAMQDLAANMKTLRPHLETVENRLRRRGRWRVARRPRAAPPAATRRAGPASS